MRAYITTTRNFADDTFVSAIYVYDERHPEDDSSCIYKSTGYDVEALAIRSAIIEAKKLGWDAEIRERYVSRYEQ